MSKSSARALALSLLLSLAGCGTIEKKAHRVGTPSEPARRIAIMPVVYGYTYYTDQGGIGSDDPCYKGFFQVGFAVDALFGSAEASAAASSFVPRQEVCAALKKHGFEGFPESLGVLNLKKGVSNAAGLTIPMALAAAREVGADAILVAAVADTATTMFNSYTRSGFEDHMVARLIDVRTGRTLWGARSVKRGSKTAEMIPSAFTGHHHLRSRYRKQSGRILELFDGGEAAASAAGVIAILPPQNISIDLQAPDVLVRMLATGLIKKGYFPIASKAQDELLRGLGITDGGQLGSLSPKKLAEALGADALLYPTVGNFATQGAGRLSVDRVDIEALLARPDGTIVWRTAGASTSVGGSVLRSRTIEKMFGTPKLPELEAAVNRLLESVPDWPKDR